MKGLGEKNEERGRNRHCNVITSVYSPDPAVLLTSRGDGDVDGDNDDNDHNDRPWFRVINGKVSRAGCDHFSVMVIAFGNPTSFCMCASMYITVSSLQHHQLSLSSQSSETGSRMDSGLVDPI